MSYLKPIKRFSAADNIGGTIALQVARKADIDFIPEPINATIPNNIVFKAGKGFITWDGIGETSQIRSTSRAAREGKSRQNRFDFRVPKDRQDLQAMFDQAEDDEFIVLLKDSNGRQKLFGQLHAPVLFEYDHETGRQLSDLNSYACSFYYDGPENRFFYDGIVPASPPSTLTSTVRYSSGETIALLNPSDELVVVSDFDHSFQHIAGSGSGTPAIVRWDTGELIASLQPGDTLVVDTDFTFDFQIIGNL